MAVLLLLFNHQITEPQREDARRSLGVSAVIEPPEDIRNLWRQVPPDLESLSDYLAPVQVWLAGSAQPGDAVLVQGDFGATWLMARFALELGLIPVYSTTERRAVEEHFKDGSVHLSHVFCHIRFRRYGE